MADQRTKILMGNWKMNGDLSFIQDLLPELTSGFDGVNQAKGDCVIFPPALYLQACAAKLPAQLKLGAQTVSEFANGAHTGEISATMLSDIGATYVIIGHSERRLDQHEKDDCLIKKYTAAIAANLTPVYCIGETLAAYEQGQAKAVLSEQLSALLSTQDSASLASLILAYEPVWAIGTGQAASTDYVQETHQFLRDILSKKSKSLAKHCRIVYGGSVSPANAAGFFGLPDVDGALVGGASLKASSFLALLEAMVNV